MPITHDNGEIIVLERGEHEDRRVIGTYRVLMPLNITALALTYHEASPPAAWDAEERDATPEGFAEYLVNNGWLQLIHVSDSIHVGAYNRLDLELGGKASQERTPTRAPDVERWTIGKFARCIVSQDPVPGTPGGDATDYYGGHLVAESVAPQNLHLIAAAPAMRNAMQHLIDAIDAHGYLEEHPALRRARKALAASLEQAKPTGLNR